MKLLLLGATGLVGSHTLRLALANDAFSKVIAPTRKPLTPCEKLVNPVGTDMKALIPLLMSYKPDAVICALGTTQSKAGSKEAFRYVDYELPLAFAKAAQTAGAKSYAIVTAMGASPEARTFYYRTKGEVERDIRVTWSRSLTICKPSLIGGERHEERSLESVALTALRFLAPLLPKRFHINSADVIAASLIAATLTPRAGCRFINSYELC
jgi:uncharacterized protein YbjT (DUF2867 family)